VQFGLAQPAVGPAGYVVAREVAASTLGLGMSAAVDAVNAVHEVRPG
jgi:hypothetical protein